MKRIIDANLNRAIEGLRVLEEIARFYLDDESLSTELKYCRHELSNVQDGDYSALLTARDTVNDVGVNIQNPTKRIDILNVFKANIKRLQQSLRVLAEYSAGIGQDSFTFEDLRYKTYTLEKTMFENLSSKLNKFQLQDRKLYLVTDRSKFEDDDSFLDAVAASLAGGVDILQLREKSANAKQFVELAKRVRELCSIYNTLFIINDRVDVAQIVDADGVHVGQDDIDVFSARKILGQDKIIGLSTHAPEQALKAVEIGADYIGVGPVFETPTKPGKKSVGLEYVEWASKNIEIPFFAIGGIDLSNVDEVTKAGATRIALVRAIINAENPKKAAEEFKAKLL